VNYINKIIQGDSLSIMRQIPSESIDLVVTSPPYNLKNSTGNGMKDGRGGKWAGAALVNGYSHYNDNIPHAELSVADAEVILWPDENDDDDDDEEEEAEA